MTNWWLVISNLRPGCCSKASSNCHAESASIHTGTCTGAMKKRKNVSLILIPSIFFSSCGVNLVPENFCRSGIHQLHTHFGILFLHTQVYQPLNPLLCVFPCFQVNSCRELPHHLQVFSASSSLAQRLQLVEKELQSLQRQEKERHKRYPTLVGDGDG